MKKFSAKKISVMILSVFMVLMLLAGCGGTASDGGSAQNTGGEAEKKEQAILAVSFGTSYNDSREKTIGAIESALQEAFPDYEVRRAFTSQIIIDILEERDGLDIDNVTEALDRAVADGIRTLIVQPTHLMDGFEYMDLKDELADYEDKFETVVLAEPLLMSDDDFTKTMEAITADTASLDDGDTAICFMGHGTEAESNEVYAQMQNVLTAAGHDAYYIGTVEAEPSLEDVMEAVKAGSYSKIVLQPLMVVAGDHANNDMAGDEEDSWKSQFAAAGLEVECVLKGLGELEGIQKLYVEHTQAAIDSLA